MDRAGGDESGDGEERQTSSQSKDDSLTDFKSPKADSAVKSLSGKLKIVGEKRGKKPSSKGKSSAGSRKKDGSASGRQNEKAQPSIESSFFKSTGKREGHTCPLCMRYFEDAYAGTGHTKSCAAKNKVSTTRLLAAVALQERQADERLAIGLPAGPLVQPRDKTPRRNRGPTLKGDPDLQLALALSKSLQENQAERELEEALLLAAEHRGDEPMPGIPDSQRRSTLRNFGFLTSKPVSDVPIKPRRKKHLGPTILQTRTQESRDRLLTERIAEILMGNEAITQVCRQESVTDVNNVDKSPVVLRSRLLKEIHISTKRLWNSAELSKGVTNFYVEALEAIVAPINRQENESATSSPRNPPSEADSPQHSNMREIEADSKSEKTSRSPQDRTNDSEDRVESPKNTYVTDRQYRNNLPSDWSNTLNVSTMSDVVVLVDKNHIWAHKLVLHVRCSDILLDCQPIDDDRFRHVREKISWPEVDYLTALAFLEFVYSGVIVKNEHVFTDDRIASLVRNLARRYRLKDLFEYMRKRKSEIDRRSEELEGRKSGLRSPIVIEVARRDRLAETVPDESPVVVEDKEEPGASASSPARRSCIVDLTIAKTPEVQFVEDDPPTIDDASASDRNRSVTSPDIFDDTTEEAMDNAETNSPEVAETISGVSNNENSNLRVLAQLIAEDNSSRADEANESDASSTASTFVDDGRPEESPVAKPTDKNSSSQHHVETPRSRTSSISNDSKKINDRKKSVAQRLPEKQKSNLSLFIEKVQRINAKSVLDSCNEDETLGEPYDRGRFRNPFNVNDSDKCTSDAEGRAEGQRMAKKGALSALEEQLMLHQEKKNNGIDATPADESVFDESSMGRLVDGETQDGRFMTAKKSLGSLEQSTLQGEKKGSIDLTSADESEVLNESSSTAHFDLEDSSVLDNAASTDDENISMYSRYKKTHKHNNSINKYRSLLIKLTEAAASEDDDKRKGSTPRIDEAIDLTQESDSEVESSPTFKGAGSKKRCVRAIVSESNDSLVSRENDEAGEKSFAAGDRNEAIASSDDAADDSFDDVECASPLSKGATGREKRKNIASPVDHRKSLNISLEYPNPQVREVDEEVFGQSLKSRRTLAPSPRPFNDSAEKFLSRRCKPKSTEDTNFVSNSEKNEELHRASRSSRGSDGLSNFEVDEEIFTQSLKSRRTLTPSPRPADSAGKSLSRRCKRKSAEGGLKDTNFVSNSERNEEMHRASRSSRLSDGLSNFDVDEEIFTQSLKSRRTLTPSPRPADSAGKSLSRRCKRKSAEGGSKDTNFVSNSERNEEMHRASQSSRLSDGLSNFDVDEEIFTQSLKSRRTLTPSPRPADSAGKSLSRICKRKSAEGGLKDTNFVSNSERNEEMHRAGRSSRLSDGLSNFDVDEEIFTQSLKSRRTLTPSPRPADSAGKSLSRRCKRKSAEGGSKDTNFVSNSERNEEMHRASQSSRLSDGLSNFEVGEEFFSQSLKSRRTLTPSPRPADSAGKSLSRICKRKSAEGGLKDTNFVSNSERNEEMHRASRSSRLSDGLSNFEVDEEIFTQSLKSRRTLTPSPRRSSESAEKSVSRRLKGKLDEGGSKATSFDNSKKDEKSHRSSRSSRGTDGFSHSSQYPDLDVFQVDEDIFAQGFETPLSPNGAKRKSGTSSCKRGSDESKAKDTSSVNSSKKSAEEEASSDGRKKRRSSPAYSDFDVFEVNDQVFTQSSRSPSLSPRVALTFSPSCAIAKSDERGRNETPRVPSPILISSSPDMDPDTARPATKTRHSNKENSFLVAEENAGPFFAGRNTLSPPRFDESSSFNPGPSRRRFSPECGGISSSPEVAEENAGRNTLSPPRLDESSSPKPGPSRRRFSPERGRISPSPAKNPLVRWNSMPTSATTSQRLKRTRTPTKSSRLALSQGVTPPVNYERMNTPELKRELEKYGIKPQKAHRARQLLTHIYNELHSQVPTADSDAASDEDEEPPAKKIGRRCSQSSEDSEPESVTSAVSVIPEEMEFADGDPPTNGDDASNKRSVKQAFTALIKEDKELQNKMLTYEPLPLELLHSMLKARGFRCKVNDLMDFLDEECITFRVQDQARRQKANRGRGKKTAANGTRKPKSQKS